MAQSVLSDGFINLCISDDANWLGEGCRVLVEGQMTSDGSAEPNVVTKVSGLRDIVDRFGAGSILTESLRNAICACPAGISLYALPREDSDSSASTAATYELTVTGPATSDGRISIFWGNSDYSVDVAVDAGDTAATIATEIASDISANFPYSATVSGDVITLVAKNSGTIGNGLIGIYNWQDRLNYAPEGVSVALVQTVVGSGNPVVTAEDYASEIGECCYSCYILSSDDTDWQDELRDHIRSKWSCDTPQCFGHGYVYNRGTLGQVLADGDGTTPELSRMAICVNDPVFPWLKNVNYGALSCCTGCENPEVSIQGQTEGLLSCVAQPQTCDACWAFDEIEQLKENGFVVTGPATNGSGALTNPYVYNDVTNYLYDDMGRDNLTWRNTNSRRLATATALSLAEQLQTYNGLGLFGRTTSIKQGVKGTNQRLMLADIRAWAKTQIGELFSEFDDIDNDIKLVSAADLQNGCTTSAGRLFLFMKYRPPIRIESITVDMSPQLLSNCDR